MRFLVRSMLRSAVRSVTLAATTWLGVWTRAVLGPAWRKAAAVWAGCAIIAAVVFGPTGMQAHDLTYLARHEPVAATVLGGTWLLVFVPIARGVIHADAARYLRSLPSPRLAPIALAALALVVLQLPWLALWLVGEGAAGLVAIALTTLAITVVAWWRPTRIAAGTPRWHSPLRAFAGVYLAALARRAGDALVRGAGLAILAGLAGALVVRNNALVTSDAARIAASVIAIVMVPAVVGILGAILDAHRSVAWLAHSLGVGRMPALVAALALAFVGAALLAGGATLLLVPAREAAWITACVVACALAAALGTARVVASSEHVATAASRMAIGTFAAHLACVIALGAFGAPLGPLVALLAMAFVVGVRR